MKFAYLILGSSFDPARDRASIGNGKATIVGVPSIDVACDVARELADDGVVAIDVCGGFRAEGARRLIEATDGRVCVCPAHYLPEQEELNKSLFAKK
jgi:hypothetical protein